MLQRALTVSGGGGGNIAQDSYTVTSGSYTTDPLPFTPTKVVWYNANSNGSYMGIAEHDVTNNIKMACGNMGSAYASYNDSGVTINADNSITFSYYSSNFVGLTRYWIAMAE